MCDLHGDSAKLGGVSLSEKTKKLQSETMPIMFVDGAVAPSTNIMDMVSPYAPGKIA